MNVESRAGRSVSRLQAVDWERGGGWTEESGFIDLGLAAIRRRTWRDHLTSEPVTSLAPSVLDALDDGAQHVASSPDE